jgi:hypothetical protein
MGSQISHALTCKAHHVRSDLQIISKQQKAQHVFTATSPTCAHYVTLHVKIGLRKVKACWFGSAKWFLPSIFWTLCQGW